MGGNETWQWGLRNISWLLRGQWLPLMAQHVLLLLAVAPDLVGSLLSPQHLPALQVGLSPHTGLLEEHVTKPGQSDHFIPWPRSLVREEVSDPGRVQ